MADILPSIHVQNIPESIQSTAYTVWEGQALQKSTRISQTASRML